MATWVTVPSFATGDIVRASTFQDIWQNLETLKNPNYAEIAAAERDTVYTTSSSTFADIDTTDYRLQFESYGNDVLVCARLKARVNSVTSGKTKFTFELDGIAYGGASGLGIIANYINDIDDVQDIYYIFRNLEAGSHTLDVQFANDTTGTCEVRTNPSFKLWMIEF